MWGGDPSCSHQLEETAPGKVLTGGTGTASAKQVSNAGSQYGNAWESNGQRAIAPQRDNSGGLVNNRIDPRGEQAWTTGVAATVSQGATCTRCGAWRGELGSESIPDCLAWARGQEPCSTCFVCHLVVVFRAVRRVLHDTGTVFCNLGDSYSGGGKGPTGHNGIGDQGQRQGFVDQRSDAPGLGPKQLLMMPARVALALQADGWVLRSAITWAKKSPMPESVRDRPTNATEMVYLLAKQPTYYYDAEAVRQPNQAGTLDRYGRDSHIPGSHRNGREDGTKGNEWASEARLDGANLRNFWLLGPEPYSAAHFATFPRKLVEPCLLAGTSARGQCPACGAPWERILDKPPNPSKDANVGVDMTGGAAKTGNPQTSAGLHRNGGNAQGAPGVTLGWQPTCRCEAGPPVPQAVLDPFLGSGTTAYVARHHGRRAVGVELNASYARLAADRLRQGVLGLEVW